VDFFNVVAIALRTISFVPQPLPTPIPMAICGALLLVSGIETRGFDPGSIVARC
jgi:hypothetical protein